MQISRLYRKQRTVPGCCEPIGPAAGEGILPHRPRSRFYWLRPEKRPPPGPSREPADKLLDPSGRQDGTSAGIVNRPREAGLSIHATVTSTRVKARHELQRAHGKCARVRSGPSPADSPADSALFHITQRLNRDNWQATWAECNLGEVPLGTWLLCVMIGERRLPDIPGRCSFVITLYGWTTRDTPPNSPLWSYVQSCLCRLPRSQRHGCMSASPNLLCIPPFSPRVTVAATRARGQPQLKSG